MKLLKLSLIMFLTLLGAGKAFADNPKSYIIVDSSGSMWGQINGTAKYVIARDSLKKFLKSANGSQDFGMVAYGHRNKRSCDDIQIIGRPGEINGRNVLKKLDKIVPLGKTPLTEAVRTAANELNKEDGQTNIILFTDGLETCGGDICALADELAETSTGLKANVIGFDLKEGEDEQLRCLADATGGVYVGASNVEELEDAFAEVEKKIIECPVCDFQPIHKEYKEIIAEKDAFQSELQDKVNDLDNSNESLRKKLNDSILKVNECEDNTNQLLVKLADLQNDNRALDESISICENAKADFSKKLNISNEELAACRKDNDDLNGNIEELKAKIDDLQASLEDAGTQIGNLKMDNSELDNKYKKLKADYDLTSDNLNQCKTNLDIKEQLIVDLEAKVKEVDLANLDIKKKNLDLEQRIKDLESELEKTKSNNELLLNRIKDSVKNLVGTINEELGVEEEVNAACAVN